MSAGASARASGSAGLSGWDAFRLVFGDSPLVPAERLVLGALLMRANAQGVAWPSDPRIARDTGLAPRTVRRTRERLRLRGVVSWASTRGRPNRYHIDIDALRSANDPGHGDPGHGDPGHDDLGHGDRGVRSQWPGSAAMVTGECGHGDPQKDAQEQAHELAQEREPIRRPRVVPLALVEIPCKGDASWKLTQSIADDLRREYPSVDPVVVAEDMARKIRAGAREAPTTRGARRMLAAWVAREATSPSRINGAPTWQAHLHAGASDPNPDYPWHPDDVRRYKDDPRWDAYMDDQMRDDAVDPKRTRWVRFEDWSLFHPAAPDSEHGRPS